MKRVAVISAGLGTARSVANLVKASGFEADLVSEAGDLSNYSHVILPGVGHFQEGAKTLQEGDWMTSIQDEVKRGKLLLGICLGMQLLGSGSDEGDGEGLALLPFKSTFMKGDKGFKVPNMGWSDVHLYKDSLLLSRFKSIPRFYFVHSYAVPISAEYTLGTSEHAMPFSSVVGNENVFGVQFHPEKSHSYGKQIISSFLEMDS